MAQPIISRVFETESSFNQNIQRFADMEGRNPIPSPFFASIGVNNATVPEQRDPGSVSYKLRGDVDVEREWKISK